jgi:hypothetical protein
MTADEISLRILCRNLPGPVFQEHTDVRLGIQKGKEVIEDVLADAEQVTFTIPLKVRLVPGDARPRFSGPFVQGKSDDPFIYLCWGGRSRTVWEGFRRAKLLLRPLTAESVTQALQSGQPIEVTVDMTDAKGAPICASLPEDKVQWDL